MTSDEVLKLIDAGFTADEIRKMDAPVGAPPVEKTEQTPPVEQTEQTEQTKQTEQTPPVEKSDINTDFMDSIKKTVEEINTKVKALQDANVKTARESEEKHLSAADVVTSFMENL